MVVSGEETSLSLTCCFSLRKPFPGRIGQGEEEGGGGGFGCTINHNASIALGFSASSLLFGKLSGIFSNFFCLFRLRFSHLLFRLRKCFFFFRIACKPEWRRMVRWSIPVVPGRHRSSHQVCLHALLSHFFNIVAGQCILSPDHWSHGQ